MKKRLQRAADQLRSYKFCFESDTDRVSKKVSISPRDKEGAESVSIDIRVDGKTLVFFSRKDNEVLDTILAELNKGLKNKFSKNMFVFLHDEKSGDIDINFLRTF